MSDPSRSAERPQLVVVAAPGRSGTSLVTGLISRLGFHVPQPEIRPNKTNPRGFGEPRWALEFHKRLMKSAGITHGDTRPEAIDFTTQASTRPAARQELTEWLTGQFQVADRVVVKDPRIVWFVQLYRSVAEELDVEFGVLTVLRHPAATIYSAHLAYSKLDLSTRAAGWLNGSLALERSTREMPRAMVLYEDLLTDWHKTLDVAEHRLGIGLTTPASESQRRDAAELVDVSLRRSPADWTELAIPDAVQSMAMRAFVTLSSLAQLRDDDQAGAVTDEMDRLADKYTSDYRTATAVVHSTITAARRAERRRVLREVQAEAKTVPAARAHARTTDPKRLWARLRRRAGRVAQQLRRLSRATIGH